MELSMGERGPIPARNKSPPASLEGMYLPTGLCNLFVFWLLVVVVVTAGVVVLSLAVVRLFESMDVGVEAKNIKRSEHKEMS